MPLTLSFERCQDLEFLKGELQSKEMIQEGKALEYSLQESYPSLFSCTSEFLLQRLKITGRETSSSKNLILTYHLYQIKIPYSSLYPIPSTVHGTYKILNYIFLN